MKHFIYIFVFLIAFSACKKEKQLEEILLNAGVDIRTEIIEPEDNDPNLNPEEEEESESYETKAPINGSFTTDLPIGIYANSGTWLAGTNANWINNDSSIVAGAAGHPVTFSKGPYYYPPGGTLLYFYAFAPQAAQTAPAGAGVAPKVTFTITGQEDVMWSSTTGYKPLSGAAVHPILNFQHKLTELQFTFLSGNAYPVSGNKVVSLIVKSQPNIVQMDVGTGVCTFSGSAGIQALSAANQLAGITITNTGTNANSPIMLKAATGTSAYLIDVVVNQGNGEPNITYLNVPINVNALVGNAHMITLTFNQKEILISATIASWINIFGGVAIAI